VHSLKGIERKMVILDKERRFHYITVSKVLSLLLALHSPFLVRQRERPHSFSVLVLNAKGGEIRGQSNWTNHHLSFKKSFQFYTCLLIQNTLDSKDELSYCENC
jgi:hypothetical protein